MGSCAIIGSGYFIVYEYKCMVSLLKTKHKNGAPSIRITTAIGTKSFARKGDMNTEDKMVLLILHILSFLSSLLTAGMNSRRDRVCMHVPFDSKIDLFFGLIRSQEKGNTESGLAGCMRLEDGLFYRSCS
jgi:hypothetical protein